MGIIGKAVGVVKGFFQHWNTPAEGDYVSSKEVVAYSVGGIGVQFVAAMAYTIAMTANCILVGSIYQITPGDLFIISTINTIVTIIMQPLKSYWIDNTPGGKGKARPYLLWLGPPCAILISLFAFIPMGWSYAVKVAVVGILFIVMNFIFQFYLGMYNTLAQLITPSSGERAKIISLSSIVYWQFGSMGKATMEELAIIAVVTLAASLYFLWNRLDYNALETGDYVASSLGVNVNGLRLLTLFIAAMLTAVIVSFMGVIAFIGLLGPHIVRRILGNDHRFLIPGSMIMGALILLVSDCVGQNLLDFTIPVGIVTSFLGGPLFLYILIVSYRRRKIRITRRRLSG